MLLEAFANNVFRDRAVHEVVTKLNRVHEFVGGNQRNLLSGNEHDGERHGQSDKQPHDVLRDAPGADVEHDLGIELGREPLCFLDEVTESGCETLHSFPSLLISLKRACAWQARSCTRQTRWCSPKTRCLRPRRNPRARRVPASRRQ